MLGLALDSTTFGVASNKDLIRSRLERLFFESTGDQIGALDRGSRILEYFHDGDTLENAQGILGEVKHMLMAYEPNIIPLSIVVNFRPTDSGGAIALMISIDCYWVDDSTEFNVNFIKIK